MAAISGAARALVVRAWAAGTGLAGLAGTSAADIIYLFFRIGGIEPCFALEKSVTKRFSGRCPKFFL